MIKTVPSTAPSLISVGGIIVKIANLFPSYFMALSVSVSWCHCYKLGNLLLPTTRSDRPRRACVVNYFADGVRSDSDEPMLNGIPVIKKVLTLHVVHVQL